MGGSANAYPSNITQKNLTKLKSDLLSATLQGKISVTDAEKLIKLINDQYNEDSLPSPISFLSIDPIEAARVYQKIMRGK
jgi:hypothetical protein